MVLLEQLIIFTFKSSLQLFYLLQMHVLVPNSFFFPFDPVPDEVVKFNCTLLYWLVLFLFELS